MISGGGLLTMNLRLRLQLAEAFGPMNRWFCSEVYGRQIDDRDTLLRYYIKSGGAADFARRFAQAMGPLNRWYCSEYYRSDIRDPEILWDYFMSCAPDDCPRKNPRIERRESFAELSLAC
jgi:hypothetical protein